MKMGVNVEVLSGNVLTSMALLSVSVAPVLNSTLGDTGAEMGDFSTDTLEL